MKRVILYVAGLITLCGGGVSMAKEMTIDVNAMPRIVFVGDSQTCGCVGAWDYPQMLSWEIPLRVFNRAVGGSNTSHLLGEFAGGTVTARQGERLVVGEGTSWFAGPYIGMTLRLGPQEYTLDHIETTDYTKRNCNAVLTELAREDFSGKDYSFEAGWRVRVAEVKPQYACFMYTVNDAGRTSEDFKGKLADIARRCRESGIQPIFLSGVPMMAAEAGGSHPGTIARAAQRAQDLQEFCEAEKLPYGDVFRTLLKLDGQHTAEWVDTIHPTTDGSLPALWALRHILGELGVAQNPYYLRGYRAPDKDLPDLRRDALEPITTSQPRHNAKKEMSEAGFDLEARRVCDEYGLLAEADGQSLVSDRAVVLAFGVGESKAVKSATLELVTTAAVRVSLFDWTRGEWRELGKGETGVVAALTTAQLQTGCRAGAVYLGLTGEPVALDYAALKIRGEVEPYAARPAAGPILWPTAGQFDWSDEGNLLPNGALTESAEGTPEGWRRIGTAGQYVSNSVIASGKGEFGGARFDRLQAPGQQFTRTVRTLDALEVAGGAEGCTGRFLIASVTNDEQVALRRAAKLAAAVEFEVVRSSGCVAVPGDCAVEAHGEDGWEATSRRLTPGRHELSFFYRAFAPAEMTAKARPGGVSEVRVLDERGTVIATKVSLDGTYVWQREALGVAVAKAGRFTVQLRAVGGKCTQYTGLHLTRGH